MADRQGQQLLAIETIQPYSTYWQLRPLVDNDRICGGQNTSTVLLPTPLSDSDENDQYGTAWDFHQLMLMTEQTQVDRSGSSAPPPQIPPRPVPPIPPRPVPPSIDTTIPLVDQRWYHGTISRATAENLLLRDFQDSSFLVRKSTSLPNNYVLSFCNFNNVSTGGPPGVIHSRIKKQGEIFVLEQDGSQFNSVPEFIKYCTQNVFCDDNDVQYILKYPVMRT